MYYFFWLQSSMWELSSPTRDGTQAPALAMQSLNHWFAREVPLGVLFFF